MNLKKPYDYPKEIAESDFDRYIEEVAEETVRRRLTIPFIIFLELVQPLSLICSVTITMATPFLEFLFPIEKIRQLEQLLERRERIQALSNAIEERQRRWD